MNQKETIQALQSGAYDSILQQLYVCSGDALDHYRQRLIRAVEGFGEEFGTDGDIQLFSAPGRTELCGNHTDHQNGKVSAVENSLRPLHALLAQRPLVVKSGRIDDHDGPKGQQLHGFGHRIGRGALYIGDHGDLLACDGVDKTRFARISATKESDMYSLTRRCRVQSHT